MRSPPAVPSALAAALLLLLLPAAAAHGAASTTLADTNGAGGGLASATDSAMTPDGRFVVFATGDPLDPRDVNGTANDVYRRDRRTGEVVLISVPVPSLGGF